MSIQRSPGDSGLQHLKKLIGETQQMYDVRKERAMGLSKRTGSVGSIRNSPCVCGSGKKFKKCCMGRLSQTADFSRAIAEQEAKEIQQRMSADTARMESEAAFAKMTRSSGFKSPDWTVSEPIAVGDAVQYEWSKGLMDLIRDTENSS